MKTKSQQSNYQLGILAPVGHWLGGATIAHTGHFFDVTWLTRAIGALFAYFWYEVGKTAL